MCIPCVKNCARLSIRRREIPVCPGRSASDDNKRCASNLDVDAIFLGCCQLCGFETNQLHRYMQKVQFNMQKANLIIHVLLKQILSRREICLTHVLRTMHM
jgi:hypothetical protein